VAYLAIARSRTSAEELRNTCGSGCRSTWYRRPFAYEALPLKPNGKVDLQALPDRPRGRREGSLCIRARRG